MDFVLLGSITGSRIVASARVIRHRRIPVIQQLSADGSWPSPAGN
jgi:hypothetical protein